MLDPEAEVRRFLEGQGVPVSTLTPWGLFKTHRAGEVRDCGGAPGETRHYQANGRHDQIVSIFGCLCCEADGSSRYAWRRAHWSGPHRGSQEPFFQPKLQIGEPGDPFEREADRVADEVTAQGTAPPIQMMCAGCAEETEDKKKLRRQPSEAGQPADMDSSATRLEQRLSSSRGDGRPLPSSLEQSMSTAFGRDLSSVRVHTGEPAVQLNRDLRAEAFTHGNHIYFNEGNFAPESSQGRRLLAHELTHVVQQGFAGSVIQRKEEGEEKKEEKKEEKEEKKAPAGEGPKIPPERELEKIVKSIDKDRESLQSTQVTQEQLSTLLATWLGKMNAGWQQIDERLACDAALLKRLKTSYRDAVSALVSKASRDLKVAELELYREHNTHIAWWLRRDLAPREDIVFILGKQDDKFYRFATNYFQFVKARIEPNLRSLLEVRDWLADHPPANGLPWGDVSVVVHANLEGQMKTTVSPGGDRVDPSTLRAAIESQTFLSLPDAVVDNATRLRIRGCALGRNQEIIEVLRSAFGGKEESPQVYAPVHLQGYHVEKRVHGKQVTTSWEEYFEQFWYVGFPASLEPKTGQLVQMFNAKYPGVQVDWNTMLTTPDATAKATYSMNFKFDQTNQAPSSGRGGAAQLADLVRSRSAKAARWTDIRETSRPTEANGRITIKFSYKEDGQPASGTIRGLLPKLDDQSDFHALLSQQDALIGLLRPLEENSNLTVADFFWTLEKMPNSGAGTFDYKCIGSRKMLRIQRALVEPDPAHPGTTRRVRPDLSAPDQFRWELPANYDHSPQPATAPQTSNQPPDARPGDAGLESG